MGASETEKPPSSPGTKPNPVLWGLLSGWVLIFLPYVAVMAWQRHGFDFLISAEAGWVYNASVLLLMPAVQGFVAGLVRGARRPGVQRGYLIVGMIWAVDTLAALFFLREGVICLIMAAPLLWIAYGLAFIFGRETEAWRKGRNVSVSLAPLVLLAAILETQAPVPDHAAVVTDSMVIHAPAETIWPYVVGYPDNPNPSGYWIWDLGLPMPTRSVAAAPEVGAYRECRFTGGQSYGERITVLEPNRRLIYRVTRQMAHPEIAGHVSFDEGEVRLTPNGDGTTTVTMTGRYRLHVRPASYFELWTQDIARHIHRRVLTYTRQLAERDAAGRATN